VKRRLCRSGSFSTTRHHAACCVVEFGENWNRTGRRKADPRRRFPGRFDVHARAPLFPSVRERKMRCVCDSASRRGRRKSAAVLLLFLPYPQCAAYAPSSFCPLRDVPPCSVVLPLGDAQPCRRVRPSRRRHGRLTVPRGGAVRVVAWRAVPWQLWPASELTSAPLQLLVCYATVVRTREVRDSSYAWCVYPHVLRTITIVIAWAAFIQQVRSTAPAAKSSPGVFYHSRVCAPAYAYRGSTRSSYARNRRGSLVPAGMQHH
jgi:hypothetical protein